MMKNRLEEHGDCSRGSTAWTVGLCLLMVGALFVGASPAVADDSGNPDIVSRTPCMQDAAGFNLVCTANDVSLGSVTNIVITDPCVNQEGDTATFKGDFEMLLTAQARHDVGLWFAEDGGDALTGTCTAVTPAYAPDPPFLDLDGVGDSDPTGTQDTCGDIDADHNPIIQTFSLTVTCIDPDMDGKLNLVNCSSWRQPGANDLCTSPTQAFPGAPSKCRCDDLLNINIPVPPPNPCIGFDCSDLDDQCNDGVCVNQDGTAVCVAQPKADSTPCEDGNICTSETGDEAEGGTDHCLAGECTGIPVDCSGEDDQCNDGVCDTSTGACEADPVADSTPCEDGNICTSETGDEAEGGTDHCLAGECTGIPVDCSGEDDQCNDGVCDTSTGACEADPVADSTPCEDGNICTSETGDEAEGGTDHCLAGECTGIPVDCSGEDDQCNDGVCDTSTGACEADPVADSTPCEDGNICTSETGDEAEGGTDHCLAGECTGIPVDCSGEDDQCNDGVCDTSTGACEADPVADSTPCEDGNICTSETGDEAEGGTDHCLAGECTGIPVDCSGEDDQCNDGVCDTSTGACEADPVADSTPCEDGNICTSLTGEPGTPDHCDGAGECVGVPVDCSALDDQCNDGVCNTSTGACEADPVADSTPCEDGFFCTSLTEDPGTPDHCFAGVCVGEPVDCNDGNPCTIDECDEGANECDNSSGGTCTESCQSPGNSTPKPPKVLAFTYENTFGDTAWDDVCITVDHPQETQLLLDEEPVSDGGTIIVSRLGGNNQKLNPRVEVTICQRDGTDCTTVCDVFEIHTSCSLPLQIDQRFGTGPDGILQPQEPADANQDGELVLNGQVQ